ncbi:GNAT family N-acetyltransferase [Peribacillus frigoritolerans]|uniref:GNAT family N-acetyltransferase n=1 Tax=Peribacillus frigoritolerans TaxID=450367 RepID=UPI002225C2DB|nr:GNAT family N-acetyltransferase [Peribacillus frigoritolerans]UYY97198.1 GNAT family N-acetyltransferase [Peribacillus frigoritolerans]
MKAILMDFPEKIETPRLYLRPCQPGDGLDLYEAIVHSNPELKQWLPFAHQDVSLETSEQNVLKAFADFILKEDIRLHIYRKEDDQFIGSTGLHRINWDIPKFEIGYWIDTRFSKLGYITETVEKLTKFAFYHYGAKRVEIRCDPNNIASKRIPEKLGFTLEGILRNDCLSADGMEVRDTSIYAKTTN